MSSSDVERNVARWTRSNAEHTDAEAARQWAADEITWGVGGVPESSLGTLPELDGVDAVELGCGTAYFGSWLARRDARVVGVDPTPAQLETARRMQRDTGLEFPLVEAAAEEVPLRIEWADEDTVEFQLPTGELFALLRESGFAVDRYLELRPPDDARDHGYYVHVGVEWARKWPAEEIWVARKE